MKNKYTNRVIGIFTDAHALYEPTLAILDDMKKRGIKEIYSLGDNVGDGPNPDKVIDLIKERNVKSIAGNSEYYHTIGIEPFSSYLDDERIKHIKKENEKLGSKRIGEMKLYPACITLLIGGKNIALCHFANDVRYDYNIHSVWEYQNNMNYFGTGHKQFLYTNSKEALKYLKSQIEYTKSIPNTIPRLKGIIDAYDNPLFEWEKDGEKLKQKVDFFDAIIQGHAHFKYFEDNGKTKFYTIRAVGMAYKNPHKQEKEEIIKINGKEYDIHDKNLASYIILKEKLNGGFDIEEIYVPFNRKEMVKNIILSDNQNNKIEKFTNISELEKEEILKNEI